MDYIIARHGRVPIAKSSIPDFVKLLRAFKARALLRIQGVPYSWPVESRRNDVKLGEQRRGEKTEKPYPRQRMQIIGTKPFVE